MNAVILLFIPALAAAQATRVHGALQGVVRDPSRAPAAQVRVRIVNQETGEAREALTNERGQYQIPAAAIGFYVLRAEAPGFAPVEIRELQISVGQTVVQDLELKLAAAAEKVEVSEGAEILQAASPNHSTAFGYERMEHSPAPGRNYLAFVTAAPGMTPSSGASTGRSPAASWNLANDSGFVFAGIRGRNNSVSIDGADNRDETTGGIRVAVPLEIIQELRIAGTTVSAEFGGAAGGQVNIVTRAGTNVWHGHGEFLFLNESINARNPEFGTSRQPRQRRYQPGGSGSGPLRKNRSFIAFALEGLHENCEEWSETPRSLAALYPQLELTAGAFRAVERDQQYSGKVQQILSARHVFIARYAYSLGTVANGAQGIEHFSDFSNRGSTRLQDHSFAGSLTSLLGPRAVNQLVVQIARRSQLATPNSRAMQIEIPGVATFGQGYRLDQSRDEDHAEVSNGLSLTLGRHTLSLGGSVHRIQFDGRLANRYAGLAVYPTLDAFASSQPDLVIRALGRPETRYSTTPLGFWFNDRWQLSSNLTAELGLRYDRQAMPPGIPAANRNFAPRFGLAWNPSRRLVLRFGSGLFYDRFPLAFLNEAIQKDGLQSWEFHNAQTARVRYLAASQFPSTYSAKLTTGAELKLDNDTTLGAEFSHVRGLNLPRVRNIAWPAPTPLFHLEQTARSTYDGVTVTLNRRATHEFGYLLSYSAGRTIDDGSDFDEQPSNPSNIALDRALSRQHQAHRFTASALLDLPLERFGEAWEHIHLVPTFTVGSARPLNQIAPRDLLRTGAYPFSTRLPGVARNSGRIPANGSLDARFFKEFPFEKLHGRLQLGIEGYNLLNKTNPLRLNAYAGQSYGQVIEYSPARQLQLFLHFEF